ncbi:serine/threonine-protein phosphatase [Brachybacterium sp. EF45031]|nr:protein phosphatase 2C domain-containing protein [Brachybacterium sillae]MCS6711091.1 serine/threonine-protein phosphatase [Brachybacterium sillae]
MGPTGRSPIEVAVASRSDVGLVRAGNEDSLLAAPPVFVVADGMGGHDAGEVASAIVVEEFGTLAGRATVGVPQLAEALERAGDRIRALSAGHHGAGYRGAGTTVAAAAISEVDGSAYWIVLNLGDSRVYRAGADVFEQVSVDHSFVQELLDRGEIDEATARVHPQRHVITRALGAGSDPDPDFWLIPAEAGDRLLVCSDGLSGEVPDDRIEQVLREAVDVESACADLLEQALDAGARDNVSLIVVEALAVRCGDPAAEDTAPRGAHRSEDTAPRMHDTAPRVRVQQAGDR